jgi:L-lactate dehydrogenase complex protein LldG
VSVSREMILARIRGTQGRVGTGHAGPGYVDPGYVDAEHDPEQVDAEYAALPRLYLLAHHEPAGHDIAALFAERAADYRATVERASPADLPGAVARTLENRAAPAPGEAPTAGKPPGRPWFIVPPGLPDSWLAECRVRTVSDEPPLGVGDLDDAAGVVTGCTAAVAETGTLVLDHGPAQGRRALSLVPDFHLVVVRAEQIEADLPGALARLDPRRPHTFISGPSATSDIELIRVEGVHGPRNLHILIAG